MRTVKILGITVSDTTESEALEFITKSLVKGGKKFKIFTPNPEIIMAALRERGFKEILNRADLALPDGIGLLWGAKVLKKQLQNRIAGVDFMESLCKEAAKQGFTVGFLGGGSQIAERTAECLLEKYPRLKISYVSSGGEIESQDVHNGVSSSKLIPNTDILFVAFGYPKQERWIHENLPKIPVGVAMAVGGSFDYISGAVPRAPFFMRRFGFEWLFRLLVQPWRIRRQLILPKFFFLVLKEKFSPSNN